MKKTTARILTVAVTATAAVALAGTGTASADTNKSEQDSAISGPVAPVLSPGTGPGDNQQVSSQNMIKRHTTNWSVVDYIELPGLPGAVAAL
ncbi:hypothetical protein [Streptomyces flavidovirens]